jgi:hypothetical protein
MPDEDVDPQLQHGTKNIEGLTKNPHAPTPENSSERFGRIFQKMPTSNQPTDQAMLDLGRSGGPMFDTALDDPTGDNPAIPTGFVFFGQFVDHDVTLDKESSLGVAQDPRTTINTRTPNLELDSLYSGGPGETPQLYGPADMAMLRLGTPANPNDLPRDSDDVALIGDPRNDENIVISQLHAALIKFHNRVADQVRADGTPEAQVFATAQRLVRWHYQWIVVHDFLPRIIDQDMLDDILEARRYYKLPGNRKPFIPVEFAVAAYRYGHSQIRSAFRLNANHENELLFSDTLRGFQPVDPTLSIDWDNFFERDSGHPPQPSRRIDIKLAGILSNLPFIANPNEPRSLAARNLMRSKTFELPSGQKACQRMQQHVDPLTDEELGLAALGWQGDAPLWFYILREAEVQKQGLRLGQMGGRMVGEVLIGILQEDQATYLNAQPQWTPTLPGATSGDFTMVDLLTFAQV